MTASDGRTAKKVVEADDEVGNQVPTIVQLRKSHSGGPAQRVLISGLPSPADNAAYNATLHHELPPPFTELEAKIHQSPPPTRKRW